jgi:hypothetical protein
MAVCPQCNGEMTEHISCLPDSITIGSQNFEPIRWGNEPFRWGKEKSSRGRAIDFDCRDCGTPPGGVHRPGCCVERCPACLGQALGCRCFYDPDADDPYNDAVPRRVRRQKRARCRAHHFRRHYWK